MRGVLEIGLDAAGAAGTIVLDGLDISHLVQRFSLIAEVRQATRIQLDFVAVNVIGKAAGEIQGKLAQVLAEEKSEP